MDVVVAFSPAARQVWEAAVRLPQGANVETALRLSGLLARFPELSLSTAVVGIWGRKTTLQQPLRDNDRVEVYRPLRVDPKVARRERFARQGARNPGLFAQRRPGAKSGY